MENNFSNGDVCVVELQVKVRFEWRNDIVVDHGYPEEDWKETKEGCVMHVMPQTIIYKGEDARFLYQSSHLNSK